MADDRPAWSVRFDRTGRHLASAGGPLRVWDLARYDRCLLGNYAFYCEQLQASSEPAAGLDLERIDRWAKRLAAVEDRMPGPGFRGSVPGTQASGPGVEPEAIASWGRFTRLRLLTALGDGQNGSPETQPPVTGATDPPAGALHFHAGASDRKVITLPDSGLSEQRARAAEYQRRARAVR